MTKMTTIVRRFFLDKEIFLIAFSIFSLLMALIYIGLYPSLQEQSENFQKIISSFPKEYAKAFGLETFSLDSFESLLASRHFGIVWPILSLIFLSSLGASAIAGEIEAKTISFTLSKNVSRIKFLLSKYIVGVLYIFIFSVISIGGIYPLAVASDISSTSNSYLVMTMLGFLYCLAIYSLSFLFSAIFSEKGKVYLLSSLVIIGMYILNTISLLKESWDFLKYFSFFYYFKATDALVKESISIESITIFAGVTLTALILAIVVFNRREIN